ncbi:carboxymuconolactone decarboxylase family protein [Methylibium petroleiphilum]|uniref:carboxymuconolactone decarboxylase family protein n=1 Tax=Methylibium petroleiphilum TaxID=105560 RepID=UPI003D283E34
MRFKSLKPGQSPDPEVNRLLDGARNGWWKDTSMFGIIARQPILLKTIVPVFEAFFGGGRIPAHVLEMMRLKTGEINDCTYCKEVRSEATREAIKDKESAIFGKVDFDRLPLKEALAVQLAEYIAGDPNYIPDGFFERLATVYTDEEVIELVFACGIFNWGNKFNITMQVDASAESTYSKGMTYPGAEIRAQTAVPA